MTLTPEQEHALIQTALAGTPESKNAINTLLECHRDALYQYAMRAVGDHDKADDAVQSTFLVAWEKLTNGQFKHNPSKPSHFRHWLLATCKNHNHEVLAGRLPDDKMLYRTKQESGVLHTSGNNPTFDIINQVVSADKSTDNSSDVTEKDVELRKMALVINKIPSTVLTPAKREIFLLHASGYTASELANYLNIKKTSAYCALSQAKKIIRKYMTEKV